MRPVRRSPPDGAVPSRSAQALRAISPRFAVPPPHGSAWRFARLPHRRETFWLAARAPSTSSPRPATTGKRAQPVIKSSSSASGSPFADHEHAVRPDQVGPVDHPRSDCEVVGIRLHAWHAPTCRVRIPDYHTRPTRIWPATPLADEPTHTRLRLPHLGSRRRRDRAARARTGSRMRNGLYLERLSAAIGIEQIPRHDRGSSIASSEHADRQRCRGTSPA